MNQRRQLLLEHARYVLSTVVAKYWINDWLKPSSDKKRTWYTDFSAMLARDREPRELTNCNRRKEGRKEGSPGYVQEEGVVAAVVEAARSLLELEGVCESESERRESGKRENDVWKHQQGRDR